MVCVTDVPRDAKDSSRVPIPYPAIKDATFSRVRAIKFAANRNPTSNLNVDPEDHRHNFN
jgi:hypothetical protein